jgi:hypothetical protein
MQKPWLDAAVESHPCAQNAQGWGTRRPTLRHPKTRTKSSSGSPLRHPKADAKTLARRCREIPPLRTKRARMGHPPSHAATPKSKNKIEFFSNL